MWSRIAAALISFASGVALVVGAELLLRAAGVAEGDTPRDPFSGFSAEVPLFEPGQAADGTPMWRISAVRVGRALKDGPVEPQRQFLADPPADLFRVFVIGGSSSQGVPYSTDLAFSGWLERRLEAALPDLPIEVVNAGMAGYGSRRVLTVVEEIARHRPDLLVVYMGHNEWAERSFYAHLAKMDPRLFRLLEWGYATRLYALASRLLETTGIGAPAPVLDMDPKRLAHEYFAVGKSTMEGAYPTPEEIRTRDHLYERHLHRIARMMRAAGSRVAFVTEGQNLADWPPAASTHRPDLSAADLASWDAQVAEGNRLEDAGDCPGALAAWRRALGLDDQYGDLHYRIAGCERRLGRLDVALDHYRLASDLDRVPHGSPRYFNEILRKVAEEEGGIFVDAEASLAELSPGGLVGDDLFVDFAHLNIRGNQRVAEALAKGLRDAGVPLPAERWREGAWTDPDPATLYAAHPGLRAQELRSRLFVCMVALREACAGEAQELLGLEPENGLARQILAQAKAAAAAQSDVAPAELP